MQAGTDQAYNAKSPIVMILTADSFFKGKLDAENYHPSVNTKFSAACVYHPWDKADNLKYDYKIIDTRKALPGRYFSKKTLRSSSFKNKLKQLTADLIGMRDAATANAPAPPQIGEPATENNEIEDIPGAPIDNNVPSSM
jgi:hypothetical protein